MLKILTKDNYFRIQHINDIFVEKYGTEAEQIPQNKGNQCSDADERKCFH